MKSYRRTIFSVLVLILLYVTGYFTFNAFKFESKSTVDIQPKYSQVRIFATSETDIQRMTNVGLIIDHANSKPGLFMDAWLSEYEISQLIQSGVPYQILVDDWMAYYNALPKMTNSEIDAQMQQAYEKDDVSHSIYGTMGGYMTYTEVVSKLDSMRMWFPQFISAKFSIGTTFEGRTMWACRVTNGPDAPTGRPQVLMHALIHAREPESMETQFYYMFWLFENYNSNPLARYILNNREIYWVPVYNADGYVYNQTTNPSGGGMWRTNRHVTTPGCGYVDINRNYGIYQFWNSSNGGSSTNACSGGQGTYRGTLPYSEIETQNMINFVNSHNFNTAFGAHTYGNYLIKPYCWSDPSPTPDDAMFNVFLADMKASNPIYTTGFPSQTVGYFVRGGADDAYYNDSAHTGHHIFAITPETGTQFWPPQSEILPLAQGMLFNNQYMSLIAGPYVKYVSSSFSAPSFPPGGAGSYKVVFRNKGVMAANNTKIILTPGNANVTIPTQQYTFNLGVFAQDSATFNFTISGAAPNNCYIPATLVIKLDTATIYSQGVFIPVGTPAATTILNDPAGSFANWTAGGTAATWNITTAQFNTPPSSFTDSPGGNYPANCDLQMTLTTGLNVNANPVVTLSFWHRYATEANYDFCNVEVSSDGGLNWQTVAAYSGTLSTWTQQTFDISSYANASTNMKVRFRLTSDPSLQADGWYVDDIVINKYCVGTPLAVIGSNTVPDRFSLEQNYPNPFNPNTQIKYALASDGLVKLTVYDILGKEIALLVNEKQTAGRYAIDFDGSRFASGLYIYKIEAGSFTDVKKMMLVK
jgi:carboxypeptidase T